MRGPSNSIGAESRLWRLRKYTNLIKNLQSSATKFWTRHIPVPGLLRSLEMWGKCLWSATDTRASAPEPLIDKPRDKHAPRPKPLEANQGVGRPLGQTLSKLRIGAILPDLRPWTAQKQKRCDPPLSSMPQTRRRSLAFGVFSRINSMGLSGSHLRALQKQVGDRGSRAEIRQQPF
jgi:hypothetical protein